MNLQNFYILTKPCYSNMTGTKPYFILDIETCPVKLEGYFSLSEEERMKFLNPIDSRIVAIGLRHNGQNKIFFDENEAKMLQDFWFEVEKIHKTAGHAAIVGFNVLNFDLPFLASRSFIHGVPISPFILKSVVDIREKINAYRFGFNRGKLKEYAKLVGLEILDIDGSDVAGLYSEKKFDQIKEYLAKDLEITNQLYKRAIETKIINIEKW